MSAAAAIQARSEATSRILVADDDPLMRGFAEEKLFEAGGGEVVTAADGLEAWDALQAGRFDLVLLDLQMPRRCALRPSARHRGHRP